MSHGRLITHFQQLGLAPGDFDHFDYVEAYDQLPEPQANARPKRRRLAEQFALRCVEKMEKEQAMEVRAEKCRNFIERMKAYQILRLQKLQAMRFIEEKFDSRNGQLRYYPKVNVRMATQRGRYWKDKDGLEAVEREESILIPNSSTFMDPNDRD